LPAFARACADLFSPKQGGNGLGSGNVGGERRKVEEAGSDPPDEKFTTDNGASRPC
jgi:hypothetical protein